MHLLFSGRQLGSCFWLAEVKIQTLDDWQPCQNRLWNKGPDGLWESDWDFWEFESETSLLQSIFPLPQLFFFPLSHCTSACTIYVLFIVLITDNVYFIVYIIILPPFFLCCSHTFTSFSVPFFSIPFAVSEQLVFLSVVFNLSRFSHCQDPHILSELFLLVHFSSSIQI